MVRQLDLFRETLTLRAYALWKIPLIAFVSPSVVHLDDERCELRIKLSHRTKNHWGTMYFGALCVGADLVGGLLALRHMRQKKAKVSLLFKDFQAEFKRRADGHVHFHCAQGAAIADLVDQAVATGQRVNLPLDITATVPSKGGETVAKFVLTLSLKANK
jgi:acyl-coenzyme A thioesterase PaaI-like protein